MRVWMMLKAVMISADCAQSWNDSVVDGFLVQTFRYDPALNKKSRSLKEMKTRKEKLKTLNWAMCK